MYKIEIDIAKFNLYLNFIDNVLKFHLEHIITQFKLNEQQFKKVSIYFELIKLNDSNDNIFLNLSYEMQLIIIKIFINGLRFVDNKDIFNNLLNELLEDVAQRENNNSYIMMADVLKDIYNLSIFINKFTKPNFIFKIEDNKDIIMIFDE